MGWGPFQFPIMADQASADARGYDALFWVISILTIVFTILVYAIIVYFALKYRRGNKVDRRNAITHSGPMEALWMGLPTVLVLGIFVWSAARYINVRTMPKDAIEIFCVGKQWMWHFQHMDGTREMNELHVPVGKPIKLTMISQDVIHSMLLPEMRAQFHVVPGRYTDLHFTPIKPGKYKIVCAMHCGTGHSEMVGTLYVLGDKEWADWVSKGGDRFKAKPATVAEQGKELYADLGCANCHTGADNPRGPSLFGLTGKTRKFTDGTSAVAGRDYIRESILNPHRRTTAGYENTMPIYQGQISEFQAIALADFIATLGGGSGPFERQTPPGPMGSDSASTTVDSANKHQSAGDAQFNTTEDRR